MAHKEEMRMIKEKLILTDVDGCLVDWNRPFEEFAKLRGYERVSGTDHSYNLGVRFGTDPRNIRKLVNEFNNSEIIAHLNPIRGAKEKIDYFVRNGFRFVAITNLSDQPKAEEYRTQNLVKNFGDIFDDIICLKPGSDKTYALLRWEGTGLFWIEDHFKNAEAGYEVGLRSILIGTPYNRHFRTDLFPITNEVDPWLDIKYFIGSEYGLE